MTCCKRYLLKHHTSSSTCSHPCSGSATTRHRSASQATNNLLGLLYPLHPDPCSEDGVEPTQLLVVTFNPILLVFKFFPPPFGILMGRCCRCGSCSIEVLRPSVGCHDAYSGNGYPRLATRTGWAQFSSCQHFSGPQALLVRRGASPASMDQPVRPNNYLTTTNAVTVQNKPWIPPTPAPSPSVFCRYGYRPYRVGLYGGNGLRRAALANLPAARPTRTCLPPEHVAAPRDALTSTTITDSGVLLSN